MTEEVCTLLKSWAIAVKGRYVFPSDWWDMQKRVSKKSEIPAEA